MIHTRDRSMDGQDAVLKENLDIFFKGTLLVPATTQMFVPDPWIRLAY